MKKDKIPLHMSTLVLMIVTIAYKLVLIIIGVLVLVIQPQAIMAYLEPVMFWMYLGVALNVICVALMLLLIFFPDLMKKVIMAVLSFARKITKSNKIKALQNRADLGLDKYKETSLYIVNNKKIALNVLGITFIQRGSLFFVTYLAVLAFSIKSDMSVVVTLQAMISVAVDMLPLPGGLGISEHLFMVVFEPVCGSALVTPVMVISRGLSFYIQLFLCAVMTLVAYFKILRKDG